MKTFMGYSGTYERNGNTYRLAILDTPRRISGDWQYNDATGVEAMLKWSLSGEMLNAMRNRWIVVFRMTASCFHVSVTHVCKNHLETHEKMYSGAEALDTIFSGIQEIVPSTEQVYLFLPGRVERQDLSPTHAGHGLTVSAMRRCFPGATVLSMEIFSRITRGLSTRRIGADARRWLLEYATRTGENPEQDTLSESLSLAVQADAAMIIRLLGMTADELVQAA